MSQAEAPQIAPGTYEEAFERVGEIPLEFRGPEHIFWHEGPDKLWYPIVRELIIGDQKYDLRENGAQIAEGAYVDKESRVGSRTLVEPTVIITRSNIGAQCLVAASAKVESSTLDNRAEVGSNAYIFNSNIGNGSTIGDDTTVHSSTVRSINVIGSATSLKKVTTGNIVRIGDHSIVEHSDISYGVRIEDEVIISPKNRTKKPNTIGEQARVLSGVALYHGYDIKPEAYVVPRRATVLKGEAR